ncbi:MAG: hypothetical protein ACI90V_012173 [Bacillariaceae sp.]|jgi:hypothetical protein
MLNFDNKVTDADKAAIVLFVCVQRGKRPRRKTHTINLV